MSTKIIEYEIRDHGVNHAQYFTGCGVSFTKFDECFTGCGNSERGALEDALDSLPDTDEQPAWV